MARLAQWLATSLLVAGSAAASHAELADWREASNRTSVVKECPSTCSGSGSDKFSFLFKDASDIAACNSTMLLSMAVQNDISETMGFRACQADYSNEDELYSAPSEGTAALCPTPNHKVVEASVSMGVPSSTVDTSFETDHLVSAGTQVLFSLGSEQPSCTDNFITIGYAKSAAVGLFVGAQVHQHGLGADVLKSFLREIETKSVTSPTVAQLCGTNIYGSDYAVGIIASGADNLGDIQEALKTWADGRCVDTAAATINDSWTSVTLRLPGESTPSNGTSEVSEVYDLTSEAHSWSKSRLATRATCKTTKVVKNDGCQAVAKRCGVTLANLKKYNSAKNFCNTLVPGQVVCCSAGTLPDPIPPAKGDGTCKNIQVVSGDGCGTLASKCGLKAADFTKLHPAASFCSSLKVGQHVCCSHGKLPSFKPKPNKDGSCSVYTVKQDDSCPRIGAAYDLTNAEIETLNKKTWGWSGCKNIQANFKMCLSSGTPPFPRAQEGAECGPTVAGTTKPKTGTSSDWADLNPCPLNVCCNVWGKCGLTSDFCIKSPADTGAPGTSKPGKNGCVSSCGNKIIKSDPPKKTMRVAYFEGWNHNRPCLTMNVDEINTKDYTHIHFAFANVTADYRVDISGAQDQWNRFKKMTGIKKIISFGGWDFSTSAGTFNILREATKPANRPVFEKNVIQFLKDHNLDGVDLDWEYPGAQDIPGIPAGDPEAGENYYGFLKEMRKALGSDKSVSFAGPASYWYLKQYPIDKMADYVDYVIYMTYDMHGQWDYGNSWASPGCKTGNCLRSHINLTETTEALSMITKAGMPSNKVVVGVTSYGRSFKMANPNCKGPNCKFTGSYTVSKAAKGRCTNTAGYISNAEINDIILFGNVTQRYKDADSNILIYNKDEWVSYMDANIKASRQKLYASYNFAGTSDWAVDLQEYVDGSGEEEPEDPDYEYEIDTNFLRPCNSIYTSLEQLQGSMNSVPPHCVNQYLVDVEIKALSDALDTYRTLLKDGYDKKFKTYETYIKEQIPSQINAFMGNGHAGDFFKCEETSCQRCCKDCNFATCLEDCIKGDDCVSGRIPRKVTCPTGYKDGERGDWTTHIIPNVTFTLEHADKFYKAINDDYGIPKEWIAFGDVDVYLANGCQYDGKDIRECQRKTDHWFWNYPVPAKGIKVGNPKDMIGASYDRMNNLLDRLETMKDLSASGLDSFMNMADLVDAGSLPSYSAQAAVAAMQKVADSAKEIKKQEREEMIVSFVTGILFFVPFVGEAAGAAGLSAVRAVMSMVAAAGDTGFLVYSIVEDPDNAFMAVFSTLAGAALGRGSWTKAAKQRRSLTSSDVDKLGPVKGKLQLTETIRGRSCKASL